jgi:hypothetical protein
LGEQVEIKLSDGYVIKEMCEKSFTEYQKPLRDIVFEEDHSIFPSNFMSDDEKKNTSDLLQNFYQDQYMLYLGVFDSNNEFIGWHFGYQESGQVFYMCNSAILKEHRRKGLYTSLLKYAVTILADKGFQVIYSRHNATNNSVIIPKLKAGFTISSLEISDVFGVLVHLKYFTNKTRRKIMDYRSGQIKPDDELQRLF